MTVHHRLTVAQYEAARRAATRPSRALEPLPSNIKGAAKQSVLAALVARGYAVKCYLPGHVEYVLTGRRARAFPRRRRRRRAAYRGRSAPHHRAQFR